MAIWTLETGNDFTKFYFLEEEDKLFFEELVQNYFDEFKPVAEKWRLLYMLRGEPMKHADFFEIADTDVLAISQKAVDALKPVLKQVELLPISTDAGNYYALNVLCFVDCLDKATSQYVATKDGRIVSYEALEFEENKVRDYSMFRIPQMPFRVFISSDIEDICEEEKLKGIVFDPNLNMVWFPADKN